MSHREEASGKTQDTLERLCLSAGLGMPRGPPGRAGGSVWGNKLQQVKASVHSLTSSLSVSRVTLTGERRGVALEERRDGGRGDDASPPLWSVKPNVIDAAGHASVESATGRAAEKRQRQ
ncbi:hypothetical protein L3Q82_012979 [Scortum barcoo]|uniref:Uncharacterized protein n=1 Tax=Scortum barcoo TaxID=214431 RepID=A0ACB8W0M6_9TELE|nr:hypothetical protein L3Q82_012979 [Scortum barcoo]